MGFGDFLLGEESILYCTGTEDLSLCILSGDCSGEESLGLEELFTALSLRCVLAGDRLWDCVGDRDSFLGDDLEVLTASSSLMSISNLSFLFFSVSLLFLSLSTDPSLELLWECTGLGVRARRRRLRLL